MVRQGLTGKKTGRLPKRTAEAGRLLAVPYGIAYRRWYRTRSQAAKKYTASGLVRRGRPLTSQTAFGGQLPYKGSLVRLAARFDYNPFMYDGRFLRATSTCHGIGYSHKSRRYALRDVPYGIAYRR